MKVQGSDVEILQRKCTHAERLPQRKGAVSTGSGVKRPERGTS
jgi:hypothetical protein